MEGRAVLPSLLLAASVVAGCGSAPATAVPQASTATDPTLVPGAVTAPPVGAGQLELTAFAIDFDPKALTAPAGPLELRFHNRDNAVPHGFAINDASGSTVFEGEIAVGPVVIDYSIPDLPPGTYTFMCPVHPNMTGTLAVVP
jgi:plastocyanin